jgi:hypothetical protein
MGSDSSSLDGAQFRWHAQEPFYLLLLSILEPNTLAGQSIIGRLYCTPKAMWKLGWFLRDFLYDPELLAHEQLDEKALPGLRGIIKISHTRDARHLAHQSRRLRSGQPVGRTIGA